MLFNLGLLALLSCDIKVEKEDQAVALNIQKVVNYGNRGLKRSFESSVRIDVYYHGELYGSGSGNFFMFSGKKFIITAAHVVQGAESVEAKERFGIDSVTCKVAYINEYSDIAVLIPQEDFKTLKPIKYTYNYMMKRGEPVFFTGYPAELEEITSYGHVAGEYGDFFVIQSVAWMGSSGSVVFNGKGQVVGIVSGVKVGYTPIGIPQVVNNVVMVAPILYLNDSHLREVLKDGGI